MGNTVASKNIGVGLAVGAVTLTLVALKSCRHTNKDDDGRLTVDRSTAEVTQVDTGPTKEDCKRENKVDNEPTKEDYKLENKMLADTVRFLFKVPLMKHVAPDRYPLLAVACTTDVFQPGQPMVEKDALKTDLFMIKEGEVQVSWADAAGQPKSISMTQGDCFTVDILGCRLPEAAIAVESIVTCARISEAALAQLGLQSVLERMPCFLAEKHEEFRTLFGVTEDAAAQPVKEQKPRILRNRLGKIGLLGCGGFASVELHEHKDSPASFALKVLSKGYAVKTGMQESVMLEKLVLQVTNSPFVVRLFDTYNAAQCLYFLLEPALGGELYSTYNRKGFHGSVPHAKYYIASLACALDHLHERYIVSRGVKPEDCVLDSRGRMKLTDMGLAKFVVRRTFTTCGTPDYFAPEVIKFTGHNQAFDWWAVGVLLFELLSGHPPFESASQMETYSKVIKGIEIVKFPAACKGDVESLIKGLLKTEPGERLPMKPGGLTNLKTHKWFEGFDWPGLLDQTLTPPYVPVVKSPKDTSNFTARIEDMPKIVPYQDDGSGWDEDFETK